jgi:hypothetical protein
MTQGPPFLTFTGASARGAAIERWFGQPPRELRGLARRWFTVMRRCGSGVRELMHDGCPTACVRGAGFGDVNAFTEHVNVGFFHGASLADPARLLQGTGKAMRHVKLRSGAALNEAALRSLIRAAYLDIRARLAAHATEARAPQH